MEQNEKTQEMPVWAKIIGELPLAIQQVVGQIASQTVQNLCLLNQVSSKLVNAMYHEAIECSYLLSEKDLQND